MKVAVQGVPEAQLSLMPGMICGIQRAGSIGWVAWAVGVD